MMIAGFFPDFVAVVLVYLYLPESPRFLVSQGRAGEAQKVVRCISAANPKTAHLFPSRNPLSRRVLHIGLFVPSLPLCPSPFPPSPPPPLPYPVPQSLPTPPSLFTPLCRYVHA